MSVEMPVTNQHAALTLLPKLGPSRLFTDHVDERVGIAQKALAVRLEERRDIQPKSTAPARVRRNDAPHCSCCQIPPK